MSAVAPALLPLGGAQADVLTAASGRAQLWVTLRHQLHVKAIALALFLCGTLPVLCVTAVIFNRAAARLVARGAPLDVSLSGGAARAGLEDSPQMWEMAALELVTGSGHLLYAVLLTVVALQGLGRVPKRIKVLLGVGLLIPWYSALAVLLQLGDWTDVAGFLLGPALVATGGMVLGPLLDFPTFARRVFFHSIALAAALVLLTQLVVGVSFQSSEATRVFVRLALHPILGEIMLAPVRFLAYAAVPDKASPVMLLLGLFAYYVLNCFGRLQIMAMETAWGAAAVIVGASIQETVLRVTVLGRDRFYARLLGRPLECGLKHREAKAMLVGMDMVAEDTGILTAAAVTLLWRFSLSGAAPAAADVLALVAMQVAVEAATDALPAVLAFLHPATVTPTSGLVGMVAPMRERLLLTAKMWGTVLRSRTLLLWVFVMNVYGPFFFVRVAFRPLRYLGPTPESIEEAAAASGLTEGAHWFAWKPI